MEEIFVHYYDDTKYEVQVEGLILLIMVNESSTNPQLVRFDSGRAALFHIIDYEDSKSSLVLLLALPFNKAWNLMLFIFT